MPEALKFVTISFPVPWLCNNSRPIPGGLDSKASACNAEDPDSIPGLDPLVGKIHWRRNWQPTPVFLPGERHGYRSLAGYSLRSLKELDRSQQLNNNNNNPKHLKWLQFPD